MWERISKHLSKYLTKYLTKYLDTRILFCLDVVLSMISSVLALLLINFFSTSGYYRGIFSVWWLGGSLVFSILAVYLSKNYRVIVRHSTIRELTGYAFWIFFKEALLTALIASTCLVNRTVGLALLVDFLMTLFLVIASRIAMIVVYDTYKSRVSDLNKRNRVLIFGTSDKAVATAREYYYSNRFNIVGFLSETPLDKKYTLAGYPVYDNRDFRTLAERLSLGSVLFVKDDDVRREESGIVAYCAQHGIKALITPSTGEVSGGRAAAGKMREINIEDVLGRPEIKISMDEIKRNFSGKVVLVTGAAGSIGSELCRQLATFGIRKLILYDNAETPMHNLRLELESRFPDLDFVPVIGSVRHPARLDFVFGHFWPQVVFHAAAYKHVPLMEENPCEAVMANVMGSRQVADKCVEYGAEMMVMISTDKAVNPTNIMGCSKRLAEIYVQSLGIALAKGEVVGRTKFVTTRFGNVLGSNGSVIPRFRDQIAHGGPVTVTHPDITRFFMTIPEACRLVMEAATIGDGNQIFVFDMGESVKIADLAKRMIELAGFVPGEDIEIRYTGLRPGEKLYEEVLSNAENTLPTTHDRIRIAKVREYPYHETCRLLDNLEVLARAVYIPEMVRMMKEIVPEFKSRNSVYESIDREIEEEQRKAAL